MEDDTFKKAALYVRVSTEEQALEGQSADAQAEVLRQYCSAFNIEIYKVYEDLGFSGKSFKDRPALSLLLEDSRRSCFDMVLVWKISRLSRNLKDLLVIIDVLERNNVCFSSFSERFDTSTPVGRMTLQLLGSIAEFERNTIIENVKLGLKEFGRKGGKACSVYGYDNADKRLLVNNKEAEVVKEIFDLYINSGMSYSAIAMRLNMQGLRTKRNYEFRGSGIANIIGNPVYIGINRHKAGEKDEFVVQGSHEPIISREIWDRAQSIKKSRKGCKDKTASNTAALSGLVACSSCGSPMTVFYTYSKNKTYKYYRCRKGREGLKHCSCYVNASKLDAEVMQFVKSLLKSTAVSGDIRKLIAEKLHTPALSRAAEAANLENEIKRLRKSKSRYLYLFESYKISDNKAFIERLNELEHQINQLKEKKSRLAYVIQPAEALQSAEPYEEMYADISNSPEESELYSLIPYIISCIRVTDNHTDIQTHFPIKLI